jgi:uncharacterized membrane protein
MKIKSLTKIAVMAAAICVATMFSIPIANGYIHLADALCMLAGCYLGPFFGALAAAIGSSLSDLFLSYPLYIPATFIIKGVIALLAGVFYKTVMKKHTYTCIPVALLAEAFMILGYYLYDALIYSSFVSAAAGLWGNTMQATASIVLFSFAFAIFDKKIIKDKKE